MKSLIKTFPDPSEKRKPTENKKMPILRINEGISVLIEVDSDEHLHGILSGVRKKLLEY